MSELPGFHFLRPWWLLALVPAWLIVWRLLRRVDGVSAWRGIIAPHLLPHLLTGTTLNARASGPIWVLGLVWSAGFTALAGPSWQHEPAPFAEDRSALVIVMQMTPSMLARDVQPSRLERAVHKIADLVERRAGAPTALIAYAGSAHRVMPLTRDGRIISGFAAELTPELMPREGDEPLAAIDLALDELERADTPGSVLLVTGSLPPAPGAEAGRRAATAGASLHVLMVAADARATAAPGGPPAPILDRAASRDAARALGASWTEVTVDDRDLDVLTSAFERDVVTSTGEATQWRDAGYPMVFVVALLALSWFRRGWLVQVS